MPDTVRTEELVAQIRNDPHWPGTSLAAARRLESILMACADLSAFVADGGSGTVYLRDNDQSRAALAELCRTITGDQ